VFDPSGKVLWGDQSIGGFISGQNGVHSGNATKKEMKERNDQAKGEKDIVSAFFESDKQEEIKESSDKQEEESKESEVDQ